MTPDSFEVNGKTLIDLSGDRISLCSFPASLPDGFKSLFSMGRNLLIDYAG